MTNGGLFPLRDDRLKADPHRQTAFRIVHAALGAVEPTAAVRRFVSLRDDTLLVDGRAFDLRSVERILVVGAGKASAAMAAAVESILHNRIADGVVVVTSGSAVQTHRIAVVEASHPLPDAAGLEATRRIAELLRTSTERDLVVCLISGGGSALMSLPRDGLELIDLQQTTDRLLKGGATINELNAVRKHLDAVKGGGLARLAQPSRVVSLILSDVVGSPLDVIASGPTAPDPTTYADALAVLERYHLRETVPASIVQHLLAGAESRVPDTPKPGDPLFSSVHNLVVGSNEQAAAAAVEEAERLGMRALLLSTFVEGEAREVGKVLAGLAREVAVSGRPIPRPACLVAGGETTVTVRGGGLGGRNQELVLGAALKLAGLEDVLVVGLATDGIDGPTDAAGALADGTTLARAASQGLDPMAALRNNDAYHFFESLGDLIKIGPTGTNVNDLMVVLAF